MAFPDFAFLLLKGLLVASVPLALVWVARPAAGTGPAERFGRLAWVTVFFTFDLIVFGAFTRLTDSGLGCPDWPGCYAQANPYAASGDIRSAEAAMPGGPVTMTKAWIEMVHRYLAMAVGVLIIVMTVIAWRRYLALKSGSSPAPLLQGSERPWLSSSLFGLVCLQGAFGAWTVTMKLQPIIVTTHLLLAMALLALLAWHAARIERTASGEDLSPGLRRLGLAGATALAVQISIGGWVSTNYAVLACTDFPLCHGQLVPEMDFANGFHLWRELGKTADAASSSYIPFAALTAIHWVHRSFALLVFTALGTLAWQGRAYRALRPYAKALALLLAAQFLTGLVTVVWSWPLAAAVLHNAGAAGLVVVVVLINYRIHSLALGSAAAPPLRTPASATANATGS